MAARYGFDERAVQSALERAGFATYRYLPRERRLVRSTTGPHTTGNTLFIRDYEFVSQRLTTARSICGCGTKHMTLLMSLRTVSVVHHMVMSCCNSLSSAD